MTEYYTLHADVLTQVSYTDDPVYLTEPLLKTTNMRNNPPEIALRGGAATMYPEFRVNLTGAGLQPTRPSAANVADA